MPTPIRSTSAQAPGCLWGFFLIIGLVSGVIFFFALLQPSLRAAWSYVETDCVVLDKRLAENRGNKGGTTYKPEIRIRYRVANQDYDIWTYDAAQVATGFRAAQQAILDRFQVGQHYSCWYDAANPGQAVLTRELSWFLLIGLVPLVFVVLGAGGLLYNWTNRPAPPDDADAQAAAPAPAAPGVSGLSAPSLKMGCLSIGVFLAGGLVSVVLTMFIGAFQAPLWLFYVCFFGPPILFFALLGVFHKRLMAAMMRAIPSPEQVAAQQHRRSPTPASTDDEPDCPTVPHLDLSKHPGTTLRYQLPSNTNSGCQLLIALGVTAFWNGIVSIFVGVALSGEGGWFLPIFLIPFVLVGLALIGWTIWASLQLISALLLGRVSLEIAEHPLSPGAQVELLLEQAGSVRLARVGLKLICSESATYQQGTRSRSESQEVSQTVIVDPETTEFDGRLSAQLTVPADAMHSFESAHNKIIWQLNLSGRVLGLLPYSNEFPLVIRPQ